MGSGLPRSANILIAPCQGSHTNIALFWDVWSEAGLMIHIDSWVAQYTGRFPLSFSEVNTYILWYVYGVLSLRHRVVALWYGSFWNGLWLFTPVWYWQVPVLSDAYAYRLSPDPDAYAYLRFGLLHSVERNVCLLRSPMLWGRHRLQAGHTSCFRLSRDLSCHGPIACLLSDDGHSFVSDVFKLAAYICYKCMLSSPTITRVWILALHHRVVAQWYGSFWKWLAPLHSNLVLICICFQRCLWVSSETRSRWLCVS